MLNPFGPHRGDQASPGQGGPSVVLRVEGDLIIPTVRAMHLRLRAAARRRDVRTVVLDFTNAGHVDSAGVATVSLGQRLLAKTGKQVELHNLSEHHKAALAMVPKPRPAAETVAEPPGFLESIGDSIVGIRDRAGQLVALIADTFRQSFAVLTRKKKLPAGAFMHHAVTMGVEALFIVGLLSFLMGMTLAFQGTVQLSRFGASVYVVDLIGISVVREFAPMMTAIILSGRAGAAIAAELGTMRAGAEIDALQAMGINPVRFLVLPRLAALSLMQPALTLLAMFIGMGGGLLVAILSLDMSPLVFADRIMNSVTFGDFVHGVGKSLIFAWIIGFTGTFFGLSSPGNAAAVGAATTRTVVVCVFFILLVDATFATLGTLGGSS